MKRPMVSVVVAALAAATLLDSEGALAAAQQVRYSAVRTPMVDVLRPVDAAARFLGFDEPHDLLARALGNAPVVSGDGDPDGLAAKAKALARQGTARPSAPASSPPATASTIPFMVDGLPVPDALPTSGPGHPLRVLVTGDSTAGEPGYALTRLLSSADRDDLDVRDEPYAGTGLVRPDAFDWSLKAASQAATFHPDVAVVFLGENDGFPLNGASPDSAAWARLYADRIQAVIDAYQAGGVKLVIWAAPPIDAQTNPAEGSNVNAIFRNVASAVRDTVARIPATAMVDQYDLFSVGGRFSHSVPDPTTGAVVPDARLADGSHLTPAGGTIVARLLLRYLDRERDRRDQQAEAAQRQGGQRPRGSAPSATATPTPTPAPAANGDTAPGDQSRLTAGAPSTVDGQRPGRSTHPLSLALVGAILAAIYGRNFGAGRLLRRLLASQPSRPPNGRVDGRPYVGARSRNTRSGGRFLLSDDPGTTVTTADRAGGVPTGPAGDAEPPERSGPPDG
ncbi:hypothetical protein GCM10023322_79930 [Rugosimonospora acidiphila]|uniref:SGNH hydrolase-type esterase domain-containing protein n=1 Tax=Rugosimonospora acidiphila TaxID=556531 RepID=A0ABP9STU7_9ACTN